MKKKITKKKTLNIETTQLRNIVLRLLENFAHQGKSIGFADSVEITELVSSLEADPTQWFIIGMQLMQVGLISKQHWEILQGIQTKVTSK
jgi:hypothetical protein